MERIMINESKLICCQEREKTLNKISTQEVSIIENVSEWIKWTKSKRICQECKEFRADSLNAMDEKATETNKDAYLKKYFVVE